MYTRVRQSHANYTYIPNKEETWYYFTHWKSALIGLKSIEGAQTGYLANQMKQRQLPIM